MQFPEHRPPPFAVQHKEFEARGNGRPDNRPPNASPSTSNNYAKGKGAGKSTGKGKQGDGGKSKSTSFTRTSYVAESAEAQDDQPADGEEAQDATPEGDQEYYEGEDANQQEVEDEGQEADQDEFGDEDLELAAHCLTVTARRLSGLKLGRKFSTQGGKTIAQRKQESHCQACGTKGHWKGDPQCPHSSGPASSKDDAKGKSKHQGKSNTDANDADRRQGAKKVMAVVHGDGSKRTLTTSNTEGFGTYFTFMVSTPGNHMTQVFAANIASFSHYLVLDTACQRTCCSATWFTSWQDYVHDYRFKPKTVSSREPFEFGHGPTQYSTLHAYLPACFDSLQTSCCLIGTCMIETVNDIPLLGSNVLLQQKLKATLDLPRQRAQLLALNCTVPIVMINGHLALDISHFDQDAHVHPVWKSLAVQSDEPDVDPELVTTAATQSKFESTSSAPSHGIRSSPSEVASSMVPVCERPFPCGDALGSCHDSGHQASNQTKVLAGVSRPNVPDRDGDPIRQGNKPLHSRPDPKIREQVRPIQPMRDVQQKMGMVRRSSSMDRAKSFKSAAAAAFTVLVYGNHLSGQDLRPCQAYGPKQLGSSHSVQLFDNHPESPGYQGPRLPTQELTGQVQEEISQVEEGQQQQWQRLRLDTSGRGAMKDAATKDLKNGNRVWLTGHLRSCQKVYARETQSYDALKSHADYKQDGASIDLIDLVEIFAGTAMVTNLAPSFGLSCLQPVDLEFGFDLKDPSTASSLKDAVRRFKPLLALIAWPCKEYSIFNQNCNYSHRMEELLERRKEEEPLLDVGCDVCDIQIEEDRYFLGENPLNSAIWVTPQVERIRNHPDTIEVTCDAGAYGAENLDGDMIKKGHRWITNSPELAQRLSCKLTADQKLYTTPIEGKHTKASGAYCPGLASAILEGLQAEARKRNPQRFHAAHNVFYA